VIDWLNLTDAEKDALNEEAYGECADKLRAAMRDFPETDEELDYHSYVADQLKADIAENNRLIKRAARSRATKLDQRSANFAREWNDRLNLQLDMLWDVEV
jgi:hypothetical protein